MARLMKDTFNLYIRVTSHSLKWRETKHATTSNLAWPSYFGFSRSVYSEKRVASVLGTLWTRVQRKQRNSPCS